MGALGVRSTSRRERLRAGLVGVAARMHGLSGVPAAWLLLLAGWVLVAAGVWLVAGLGWALLVAGVLLIMSAVTLVDVDRAGR